MKKVVNQMFLSVFFLCISILSAHGEGLNAPENSSSEVQQDVRHFSMQVMPISLMYGILGADLGLRLAPRWSLHGSVQRGQILRTGLERVITEFMANAQYHLSGDFGVTGWNVMAGVGNVTTFRTVSSSRNLYTTAIIYEWVGDSTWVASLGLGVVYQEGTDSQRFQPDMIFKIGMLI